MKKIDLGQLISILANLGVIAGILFLAYEIRQNNQFLAEQTAYSILQNQISWTDLIGTDADAARLVFAPGNDSSLTQVEEIQRFELLLGVLGRWEWEFRRFRMGIAELPPIERFRAFYRRAQLERDWDELRPQLTPEFAVWLDANVVN